jgi:ABC-type transport system substrate-binding protein
MWFVTITFDLWNAPAWFFNDDDLPEPRLVTEMPSIENGGITDDGRTITLNLRDDIQWSDGTPITANDFAFTFDMIMDPANIVQSTYPYDNISSVTAVDDQTVVMTFEEPFAPWMTLWRYVLPEHILGPVFEAEGTLDAAEWNLAPTAVPPFTLSSPTKSSKNSIAHQTYRQPKSLSLPVNWKSCTSLPRALPTRKLVMNSSSANAPSAPTSAIF